ncbi:MAG TPA: hypothetical protein VMM12_16400 [Longimicrobiales bacterium]|nr:hypothetical protein [Longimicrobiales bacterium]
MTRALATIAVLLAVAPAAAQQRSLPGAPGQALAAVDTLVARGRLQEAAWAAREAGDTARAERLLARLDTLLRAAPLDARPLAIEDQGVSYTFRLRHGGGVESIFKVDGSDIFCASCGASREVAVYRIDQLLGLDLAPMTVFRTLVRDGDTLRGSAMYFVHGALRPADLGRRKPDRLRLLDAIVGNSDRHGSNWLVRDDGSVVAIDHNRSFDYRPSTRTKTCWETEVDSLAAPGDRGPAFERYRTLPGDSLAAAVAGVLEQELAERFVAMRDRIVDRVLRRAREPARPLPRSDCPWEP